MPTGTRCGVCIEVEFTYIGDPYNSRHKRRMQSNRLAREWVDVKAKPARQKTVDVHMSSDAVSTSCDDAYSSRIRSARKAKRIMHSACYMPSVSLTPDQEAELAEMKASRASRVREVQLFTESLPELTYRAQPESCSRYEKGNIVECAATHVLSTEVNTRNADTDLTRREIIERRLQRRHARRGHAAARGQACGSPVDLNALDYMNLGRCSSFTVEERHAFRVYGLAHDNSRMRLCNVFNASAGMTMYLSRAGKIRKLMRLKAMDQR